MRKRQYSRAALICACAQWMRHMLASFLYFLFVYNDTFLHWDTPWSAMICACTQWMRHMLVILCDWFLQVNPQIQLGCSDVCLRSMDETHVGHHLLHSLFSCTWYISPVVKSFCIVPMRLSFFLRTCPIPKTCAVRSQLSAGSSPKQYNWFRQSKNTHHN